MPWPPAPISRISSTPSPRSTDQLDAASAYAVLREIETQFGRERRDALGVAARSTSISSQWTACSETLTVSLCRIARMHERAFVLAPLAEDRARIGAHPDPTETAAHAPGAPAARPDCVTAG